MKTWWNNITLAQKIWIIGSTLAIALLGIASGDTWINILIGTIGMCYVAVYSSGARGAFLMGAVYVSFYTIICLKNRIMLDALQNIILIPIYIWSIIYWGKKQIRPTNLSKKSTVEVIVAAVITFIALYGISKLLHGNYSALDAFNTTCTLAAMFLGMVGASLNWACWSLNNIASAVTFGLALSTPTGSITVFAMKCIFLINGFIGWYNFVKIGKEAQKKFENGSGIAMAIE